MTTHSGERLSGTAGWTGAEPASISLPGAESAARPWESVPAGDTEVATGFDASLDAVLDAVTVGVLVHDDEGHVLSVNDAGRSLLAGLPTTVLHHAVTTVVRSGGGPRTFTLTTARPDGSPRHLVATAVPMPGSRRVITTVRDTAGDRDGASRREEELTTLRRAVDLAEDRWRAVLERSPIGTALVSNHGRVLDGNKVLARMLGRDRDALAGLSLAEITHPEDGAREARLYDRLLTRAINAYELEKRYLHPDGHAVWVRQSLAPVPAPDGGPAHFVLQAQDITETRAAVARLTHQARHDPLTGLANRAVCVEAIQRGLDRSGPSDASVAVLACDLDDFRLVNDGIGPGPGDAVLVEVARRITAVLEPGDLAARLGADEFVVVRPQIAHPGEATRLAEEVLAAVHRPIEVGGRVMVPTASVGIAVSSRTDSDSGALLRDAGAALHRAKTSGRGGWDLADDSLRRDTRERVDLEHELRTAVGGGQLRLHLQPIVDLTDGHAVGHEALVRWQHPEHGLLPPARFLPLAEQSGLIDDLGRWVLGEAARVAAADPGLGYVAVNVSPSQVGRAGLADDVAAALQEIGLEPARMVIELTESVMLSGTRTARDQLQHLHDLGVRIMVDDFGTGFSALSHLRDLPVSGIKVDRSFTQGLGRDRQCERIVEALTGLAGGLDVDLVVEGVETEQQAQLLADIGCRHAQGYLFGRPQPAGARPGGGGARAARRPVTEPGVPEWTSPWGTG